LDTTRLGEEIKDWVISILIAVVLAFFIRYFIVELYMVEGPSMRPTLVNGERLVVNKFIYRFKAPEKGEVLIFKYPKDPSRDFIKRVIAVAGDKWCAALKREIGPCPLNEDEHTIAESDEEEDVHE
jgi:signal peptidase I